MIKNTRKQHFVSQAHIRNFSFRKKNEDKVIVLDKIKKNTYIDNVSDVAFQKDFYEVNNKPINYWENWYCKIECNIPNIYNSISINARFSFNGKTILNDYLKEEMSLIIISQLIRTRVSKNYFMEIGFDITSNMIKNTEEILKNVLTDEQINNLNKYKSNEDFVYSTALDHLNSDKFIKKVTNILCDKTWVIYRNLNYKTFPFVTSDNPVILYNIYNDKVGLGNNGLIKKNTIIFFPINSELLVVLYPKNNNIEKHNNKIYYLDDIILAIKIFRYNYQQCERHVFGQNNKIKDFLNII